VALGAPLAEPFLAEADVTANLQAMFREGVAVLRASLPAILGIPPPPAPDRDPRAFSATCRDWVESIRAAPAALSRGSSRLASPPPVSFLMKDGAEEATQGAWEEEQLAFVPSKMDAVLVGGLDRVVPDDWEDEVANEAWFDAKDTNVEELP